MSRFLYNIALHAYASAARLASLRSAKVAEMLRGQKECLDSLLRTRQEKAPDGFDFWVHAASLGEFEQARPLIEAIRKCCPSAKILLSFFSPSGYKVRHSWPGADAVVYLPFDTPSRVRRFIDAAAPHCAIFVKYEFWANYLEELHRRQIPTYIVSAIFRKEQRFFKPWGGFWRKLLQNYDHLFVQDENSRHLLADIGMDKCVSVAGDTRFDRVAQIRKEAQDIPAVENFAAGCDFTIIVGSSWQADEDLYIPWLKANPEVKAIIAPHEFDKQRLELLKDKLGNDKTVLLSELSHQAEQTAQYLIIDCFGLLSSIYRYGQLAIVGGGFGAGIHNINEAAVYGIPVLFGPNNHKFREAAELQACGGGFCYDSAARLTELLNQFYTNTTKRIQAGSAAGKYIADNIGATDRIIEKLKL